MVERREGLGGRAWSAGRRRRAYALPDLLLGSAVLAAFLVGVYATYAMTHQGAEYEDFVDQVVKMGGLVEQTFAGVSDYSGVSTDAVAGNLPRRYVTESGGALKVTNTYHQPMTVAPVMSGGVAAGFSLSTRVPTNDCARVAMTDLGRTFETISIGSASPVAMPLGGTAATTACRAGATGEVVPVAWRTPARGPAAASTGGTTVGAIGDGAGGGSAGAGSTSPSGGSGGVATVTTPGTGGTTGGGATSTGGGAAGTAPGGTTPTAGGGTDGTGGSGSTGSAPGAGTGSGDATQTGGGQSGTGQVGSGQAGSGGATGGGGGVVISDDPGTSAVPACVRSASGPGVVPAGSDGKVVQLGTSSGQVTLSGAGRDRLVFCDGEGSPTVTNSGSGYDREDDLVLSDLLPSQVVVTRDGDSLTITSKETGNVVTVPYEFNTDGGTYGLGSVTFADGSTWDRSAIASNAWMRTGGLVPNYPPFVTVDAPAGDQTFYENGYSGAFFDFGADYGHDTLVHLGSGYDRGDFLVLVGLTKADVTFARVGDDLVVSVPRTGATFTVKDHFYRGGGNYIGLTGVWFGDGTTLNIGQINEIGWFKLKAGDGDLVMPQTGNVVDVTGGDHRIEDSGDGGNLIRWGTNSGNVRLANGGGGGYVRTDQLYLRDVNPVDVRLTRSGDSLTVTLPGGQTFVSQYQFSGDGVSDGLGQIIFPEGTTWDRAAILRHLS